MFKIFNKFKNRRKQLALVKELMQTQVVMMEGTALANYRRELLGHFNQHIASEEIAEVIAEQMNPNYMIVYKKGTREVTNMQFFDENNILVEENATGDMVEARDLEEDEERVLMLELTGPVTRSGGMCSYGSIDMRDIMLRYADDKSVAGLVLITDTPGGTAFALHDFKQGMEAWNAAGKRSIQWIDGMSASAGVALGSQCQHTICMNEKDVVGCIGAMMAGWTLADGATSINGERFMDITATQTPDKNGEFRDAAKGDYDKIQKMVDECADDFLNLLAEVRPQIKDEHKTGHTYDAKDVVGSLVDGFGTLDQAIDYALTGATSWTTSPDPSQGGETKGEIIDPKDDPDHNPDEDPDFDPEDDSMNQNTNQPDASAEGTTSQYDMTLLEKIAAALGIPVEAKQQAEAPAAEQTVETPAEETPAVETPATEETPAVETPAEETPASEETVETPAEETPAQPEGEEACKPKDEEEENPEDDPENPEGEGKCKPKGKCKPEDGCDPDKKCEEQEALINQMTEQIAGYDKQVTELLAERDSLKASYKEEMEQNATAQSDLKKANEEIDNLKKSAEGTKADYTKGIEAKDAELSQVKDSLEKANARVAQLEGLLKEVQAELTEVKEEVPAQPQAKPAPHAEATEEEDNTPNDFTENMSAAELIAVQKKKDTARKNAKRNK